MGLSDLQALIPVKTCLTSPTNSLENKIDVPHRKENKFP